jgi:hypothetical protein
MYLFKWFSTLIYIVVFVLLAKVSVFLGYLLVFLSLGQYFLTTVVNYVGSFKKDIF